MQLRNTQPLWPALSCRAQIEVAKRHPKVTARSKVSIPSEKPTRKVVILGADTERGRQKLWYFSFGSNMDPECLTQHRGVKPTASHACSVEGFTLAFTYRGDAHCVNCHARGSLRVSQWQESRQSVLRPATVVSSAAESLQAPMQAHSGSPLELQASHTQSLPLR